MDIQKQIEKDKKMLKASYDMYEQTIKETKRELKKRLNDNGDRMYSDDDINDKCDLIREAQKDIVIKYKQLGGTEEELMTSKRIKMPKIDGTTLDKLEALRMAKKGQKQGVSDVEYTKASKKEKKEPVKSTKKEVEMDEIVIPEIKQEVVGGTKAVYDVIPLPSKGECYKHKMSKIPVSYLTAYDENLIVSPNLYRDGTFIEYLLREKIMTNKVDPLTLTSGDRDAIILWLRASGYGNEFPVTATDDVTGEKFDTVVDLSQIKFKEFKLKGDENGYFDFTMPVSKDNIKFKFLNYQDEKNLELLETVEDKKQKREKVLGMIEDLENLLNVDDTIDSKYKIKINEAIRTLESWSDEIEEEDTLKFNHAVTNKLQMCIVSVNDITDRDYISDYVLKMNVRDASAFRRYITDNEPGLDFNITVQKPESLGGGSMPMFLSLDQFIFLNIA